MLRGAFRKASTLLSKAHFPNVLARTFINIMFNTSHGLPNTPKQEARLLPTVDIYIYIYIYIGDVSSSDLGFFYRST